MGWQQGGFRRVVLVAMEMTRRQLGVEFHRRATGSREAKRGRAGEEKRARGEEKERRNRASCIILLKYLEENQNK